MYIILRLQKIISNILINLKIHKHLERKKMF